MPLVKMNSRHQVMGNFNKIPASWLKGVTLHSNLTVTIIFFHKNFFYCV